jgi:hypothetical protein
LVEHKPERRTTKKPPRMIPCEYCKAEFHAIKKAARFCCRQCAWQSRVGMEIAERTQVACLWCYKLVQRHPHAKNRKYCDSKCGKLYYWHGKSRDVV